MDENALEQALFLANFIDTPIYLDPVSDTQPEPRIESKPTQKAIEKESTPIAEAAPLAKEKTTPSPYPSLSYKGQNQRGLLVVFETPQGQKLPKAQADLMLNILKAINYSLMEDAAFINIGAQRHIPNLWEQILELPHEKMLIFGIKERALGSDKSKYDEEYYFEGKTYILSHSFDELEQNVAYKKSLWATLKKVF